MSTVSKLEEASPTQFEIENTRAEASIDVEAERTVRWKTDKRLVPLLFLLLIIAFLDRTNIGNARLQGLEKDLHMKGQQYNIALFMFFIPYILLDIPLNIFMKRIRPSIYLGCLMVAWGIVTIGEGVTKSYAGLVICRVLLGCFEAGFFPGAIYLMAMYYTRYELHTRMSLWYSAGTLSSAFGGLLAYAISHMDGVSGYSSWRWLFILEGCFTIAVGGLVFFVLPDWPEQAKFLHENERILLLDKLARDTKEYTESKSTLEVLKETLGDPKVLLCGLVYFGTAVTGSSTSFFLPSILKQLGWTSIKAQYMSIPIWLVGWIIGILNGFGSDKVQKRWPFVVVPLTFSIMGYAILIAQKHVSVHVRYMALFFVVGGCFASIALSLTWMNNNILGKKKRGIATAAVLALGNCGSVLGSNIYLSSEAPGYVTGYSVSLSMILLAQLSAGCFLLYLIRENAAKAHGKRDHLLVGMDGDDNRLGDKHPSYRYAY